MSNSLVFCKATASDPSRSVFADSDWSKAVEIPNTETFFDKYLRGNRKICIDGLDEEDHEISLDIDLVFNDNAEFEYFTTMSCVHDGTLLFIQRLMEACVWKVCRADTYNKRLTKPKNGDRIKYTIGNFVILNEYDKKFAPEDKPWMQERTIVLLPLKFEIES